MSFEIPPFCKTKCGRIKQTDSEDAGLETGTPEKQGRTFSCPAYVGPRMLALLEESVQIRFGVAVPTLQPETVSLVQDLHDTAEQQIGACVDKVRQGQRPVNVYEA